MSPTDDSQKDALLDDDDCSGYPYTNHRSSGMWYNRMGLTGLLVLSLVLNAFLLIWCFYLSINIKAVVEHSDYAHLTRDITLPWTANNPYFGEDEIAADQLWEDISIDSGIVALEDSYVKRVGLPQAQRFPWDQNKGLYLVNGFHSMHCLKNIRQTVLEFDRGLDRSEPTEHILHCLDALRQDVLCYADDTPRYTGFQRSGSSGTGQFRKCRSWSALDAWGQKNTACYRYINPHNHTFDLLERHRFCPEGSPYIEKVKQAFS
ncbi:hypothetical protein MMC30_008764 [Trapelia coarctata]|nr:hypothetical protein [Trapelia coarctata]